MSRQIVPRRVSGIHGRAGYDPKDETTSLASALFDQYCTSNTFAGIMSTFQQLCDCLELKPSDHHNFYYVLKSRLQTWRAQSLWVKLDKRAQHRDYKKGKACANTRVLVIGGGPCGLRTAIEVALLGGKAVIVEKRDRFSRNNVLHLWPFVIHDLKALGAKKFFGKFCTGAVDHISIRTLQCILLKVALLVGVEVHPNVSFDELLEPPSTQKNEKVGWRALTTPRDHPVSEYEFDVIVGADGKRNTLHGFKRKEFRGKLAIAITANFINRNTNAEARVEEISGVAFIFNQKFFKDLNAKTGIDLENIVYYKDETHYFVMTAKKQSLLAKGVLIYDFMDTARLLSQDNVDQQALLNYAREAADVSTRHQLPHVDYAHNHYGQPDVAMFDFTSIYAAEHASRVIERNGHKVLMGLCGDSLMEPFWPTGSGCARGFLGALDAAWMIRNWASGRYTPLEIMAERESIYQLLSQTTPENLSKNFNMYSIDPSTRYPNVNTAHFKPFQVRHQYDGEDTMYLDQIVQMSEEKSKRYEWIRDSHYLQKWFARQLEGYTNLVKILDLTSSWRNGLALCALIHKYRPALIDVYKLDSNEVAKNNQMAFDIALKEFGIPPVMSGADMAGCDVPDKLTMVSYLSQFYEYFRKESIRPAKVARSPDQMGLPRSSRAPHPRSPAQRLSILSRISNRMRARKEEEKDPLAESERIRPTLTFTQSHARKRIHDDAVQDPDNVVLQSYSKFEGGLETEPASKFTRSADPARVGQGKNKVTALAKGLAHKLKGERSPPQAKKAPAAPKSLIMGQAGSADHCYFCKQRVYLVERHAAEGVFFHRGCLKCEFCYSNLRIGQYGFQRTEDGEAKFYCLQHIGMIRPMRRPRKRYAEKEQDMPAGEEALEAPDDPATVPSDLKLPEGESKPEAVVKPARVLELSGCKSQNGAANPALDKTPERIEYYTESEVEESEFEQTAHNLSASLLGVDQGELGSESDESSSSDELEWSDGDLSDGDASWAQIAVSYNKLNRLRKERRIARKVARAKRGAGSGSDTETPGSSDNNWQSESETEKESEGEESDEEIRRRNRRRGVPSTSTPDHERGYYQQSLQASSPFAAGPLRSPPIDYEEKEPSQAATAILKNRMSFFSAVAEPVRIDPFSFLGLSPAPNIAQGDSLLDKPEPKESTEEEEEPPREEKPKEEQAEKSEEEDEESDSSLSETETMTEGSESEEDQTGLVKRVHHPIPTISIEEVDMVDIPSDEFEEQSGVENEKSEEKIGEVEEPTEGKGEGPAVEPPAVVSGEEPGAAAGSDLQKELDLMELEVELMKESVGDKIVELAKVNEDKKGETIQEEAIIGFQDVVSEKPYDLTTEDTDLSEVAGPASEPLPVLDELLVVKAANQDLMKEIITVKSEPFDIPFDSLRGPPKRTSSSELESFENIEKILRQASEDQNTDVDIGEGMPSEEIVDDWINSSWAASTAAAAAAAAAPPGDMSVLRNETHIQNKETKPPIVEESQRNMSESEDTVSNDVEKEEPNVLVIEETKTDVMAVEQGRPNAVEAEAVTDVMLVEEAIPSVVTVEETVEVTTPDVMLSEEAQPIFSVEELSKDSVLISEPTLPDTDIKRDQDNTLPDIPVSSTVNEDVMLNEEAQPICSVERNKDSVLISEPTLPDTDIKRDQDNTLPDIPVSSTVNEDVMLNEEAQPICSVERNKDSVLISEPILPDTDIKRDQDNTLPDIPVSSTVNEENVTDSAAQDVAPLTPSEPQLTFRVPQAEVMVPPEQPSDIQTSVGSTDKELVGEAIPESVNTGLLEEPSPEPVPMDSDKDTVQSDTLPLGVSHPEGSENLIGDNYSPEPQIVDQPPTSISQTDLVAGLLVENPLVPASLALDTGESAQIQNPSEPREQSPVESRIAPIALMEDMPFGDKGLEEFILGPGAADLAFSEAEIQGRFAPVASIQEMVPPEEVANRVAEVLPFTVSKMDEQTEVEMSSQDSLSPHIIADVELVQNKESTEPARMNTNTGVLYEGPEVNVGVSEPLEKTLHKESLADHIERELQEDEVLQIFQEGDAVSKIEMLPAQPKTEPCLEEAPKVQELPETKDRLNKQKVVRPVSAREPVMMSEEKVNERVRSSIDDLEILPAQQKKLRQTSEAKLKKENARKLVTQAKVVQETENKLLRQMSAPEPETAKTKKPANTNVLSKGKPRKKVEYVKVPKIKPLNIPDDIPLAEAAAAAARARLTGRPLSVSVKTKSEKEEEVTRKLREEHRRSKLKREQEEQQAEEQHRKRKEKLRRLREEEAQRKKEQEEARRRREEEAKRLIEEVRRKEEALERKKAAERQAVREMEHLESWKQEDALRRIDDLLVGLRGPVQSKGDTLKSLCHKGPEDIGELAQELITGGDLRPRKQDMSVNGSADSQKQPQTSGDGEVEDNISFHVDETFITTRDKRKRIRNLSNQSDSSFTISTPSGSVRSVSSISEIDSTPNSLGASLDTGSFDQLATTSESVGENISLDGLLDNQGEENEEPKDLFRSKSADADVTLQDMSNVEETSLHTAESSLQESRSANTTSADESQYFTPNTSSVEPAETSGKVSVKKRKPKSLNDGANYTISDRKSVDSLGSERSSSPLYSPGKAQLLTDAKRKFFFEMPQPVRIDPKQMFSDLRSPQGKHRNKTLAKSLKEHSENHLPDETDRTDLETGSTAAEKMKEWKSMDAGAVKKAGGLDLVRDWQSLDTSTLQNLSPTAGVPKTNIVNGEATADVFYTPAASMKTRPVHSEDEEGSSFKKPQDKKMIPSTSREEPNQQAYSAQELKVLREAERERRRQKARERARMLSDEELGIDEKATKRLQKEGAGEQSEQGLGRDRLQQDKMKSISKDLRSDISKLVSKPIPPQLQKIEDNARHERMGSDSSSRSGGSGSQRTTSEASTYGSRESPKPHAFSDGASDHSDHSPSMSRRDEIKEKTKSLDRAKLKRKAHENKKEQEVKGKTTEKKEKRRSFLAMLLPKKDKDKAKEKEDKKEKKTPAEKNPVVKLRSKIKASKSAEKEKDASRESAGTDEFNPFFEDAYGLEVKEREKLKERLEQVAPVASKARPKPQLAPKATVEEFDTESELGDDRISVRSFHSQTMTDEDKSRYVKKQQKAAVRRHREQELKRLRMAQEIQRQLEEVEIKQRQIEMRGIAIERALRGDGPDATRNEANLMQDWFNVVHEKNVLVRYESELMVHARELELEDRHSRLEQQLRDRMSISEVELSPSQKEEEQRILEELLEVVEQRDSLVALLEEDRLRLRDEEKRKKIAISNR